MTKKEKHNKFCRKSKQFKPTFEGRPYLSTPKTYYGMDAADLYACNLCGLQFIKIRFSSCSDSRYRSGLYEWKGVKTKYPYKIIGDYIFPFYPKIRDEVK